MKDRYGGVELRPIGFRPASVVQQAMAEFRHDDDPRLIRVTKQVEEMHGVSLAELRSPRRFRRISYARRSFYQMAAHAGVGVTDTARFLFKDHSTVIHVLREVGLQFDGWFRGDGDGI